VRPALGDIRKRRAVYRYTTLYSVLASLGSWGPRLRAIIRSLGKLAKITVSGSSNVKQLPGRHACGAKEVDGALDQCHDAHLLSPDKGTS
jgi:hypothetical protein